MVPSTQPWSTPKDQAPFAPGHSAAAAMQKLEPRLLAQGEKLTIKRVLGRGGFACAYEAKWEAPGATPVKVALKVLLPVHSQPDGLYWQQFVEEAAFLRSAVHRNIVTCFDLVQLPAGQLGLKDTYAGPTLAMLLEYIQDGTVAGLVQQGLINPHKAPYSLPQAFSMALDIASSLSHLHQLSPPVVHRDLKLENMLVMHDQDKQLVVKTADYGLHTRLEPRKQHSLPRQAPSDTSLLDAYNSVSMPHASDPYSASSPMTALCISDNVLLRPGSPLGHACTYDGSERAAQASLGGALGIPKAISLSSSSLLRSPAPGEAAISARQGQSTAAPGNQLQSEGGACFCLTGETGSPLYMAPEVFQCKPYGTKADVFSFGVLLYEIFSRTMLVFTHLGQGRGRFLTADEYAREVACNGWRPPRPNAIPSELWQLVEECWAQDPNQRPSMGEVMARLTELQALLAPPQPEKPSLLTSLSNSLTRSGSWKEKLAKLF